MSHFFKDIFAETVLVTEITAVETKSIFEAKIDVISLAIVSMTDIGSVKILIVKRYMNHGPDFFYHYLLDICNE